MKGKRLPIAMVAACALAVTAACSSSGGFSSPSSSTPSAGAGASSAAAGQPSKTPITLMFGSSGDAETSAVKAAAAAFTAQSGIKVNVIVASNLSQQVAQGFAGNEPPDVFYLDPLTFQSYAKDGVLDAYSGSLPNASGFATALKSAFTYKGTFTCAPKDASTLALYVNTQDWAAAGLGAPPATWSQLQADAKKLTTGGRVGLVIDQSHSELDEFLYQNGGTVLNPAGTTVELDSPQNVAALSYVKGLLTSGVLKFPPALSAGWSGEAFGKDKAAMAIVGNWMNGALQTDYPTIKFKVYPLPTGPNGTHATISFTNCWGVPSQSKNLAGAIEFVKFLTTATQEMTFAKAFGVIPSLQSAQAQYSQKWPQYSVFVRELPYAHPDIAIAGATQALSAFDSSLAQLASSSPSTILKTAQQNLQAVVNSDNK